MPAQGQPACDLVLSPLDERVYGHPQTHVGRDRANISDKSVASLANQIALPKAQQRRSAASGDATSRCPNMDGLDRTRG